jgi:hypothetical protein
MSIPFDHNRKNNLSAIPTAEPSYDEIVRAHTELGCLIAQRDMLLRAMSDDRLHRVHRLILKYLITAMGDLIESCPSVQWIAEKTGYSLQVVKNHLGELVRWGLITSARRAPSGGGRAVAHYTPTLRSLEELRAEIRRHVDQLERRSAPRTWQAEVTPGSDLSTSKVTSPGLRQEAADVTSPGLPQDLRSPPKVTSASRAYIKNARAGLKIIDKGSTPSENSGTRSIGKTLLRDGITLPAALQEIIDGGSAPRSATTLIEEIEAALDRGLERVLIEEQLRAAIVWADKDGEASPSAVLHRCAQFIRTAESRPRPVPSYRPDPLARDPNAGSGFTPTSEEWLPPEFRSKPDGVTASIPVKLRDGSTKPITRRTRSESYLRPLASMKLTVRRSPSRSSINGARKASVVARIGCVISPMSF